MDGRASEEELFGIIRESDEDDGSQYLNMSGDGLEEEDDDIFNIEDIAFGSCNNTDENVLTTSTIEVYIASCDK